jgi:hypothetical protein
MGEGDRASGEPGSTRLTLTGRLDLLWRAGLDSAYRFRP